MESGSVVLNTLHCALTAAPTIRSKALTSIGRFLLYTAAGVNIGEPIVHRTSPIVVPLVPVPLTTIGTELEVYTLLVGSTDTQSTEKYIAGSTIYTVCLSHRCQDDQKAWL